MRSPLAIMESVQVLISRMFIPFNKIAISNADICSSAIAPLVYSEIVHLICSSVNSNRSRLAEIISTAENCADIKIFFT